MLHWKVSWTKGPPPENCECVSHRKRRHNKRIPGIALLIAAALLLVCFLPPWVLAVIAVAVLIALALVWLCL